MTRKRIARIAGFAFVITVGRVQEYLEPSHDLYALIIVGLAFLVIAAVADLWGEL